MLCNLFERPHHAEFRQKLSLRFQQWASCGPHPPALIDTMKPIDSDETSVKANLHLFLLALCVAHASLSATVWFASCELSDSYQIGMDRLHMMFNPVWGWLGMFVVSLCFWRAWAIRQLMFSLWGLVACCCFAFMHLHSESSPGNHFGPASDLYGTVIRSIQQPSLSNDSFGLLFFGVTIVVDSALAVAWLGLFATDQNETACLRARIFALAFVLPTTTLIGFFGLNLQQLWTPLVFGLGLAVFGAPIVYLAICIAVHAPHARFLFLITSTLIAAVPALLCGGVLTVIIGVPCVLICAIVGASYINLPSAVNESRFIADH